MSKGHRVAITTFSFLVPINIEQAYFSKYLTLLMAIVNTITRLEDITLRFKLPILDDKTRRKL